MHAITDLPVSGAIAGFAVASLSIKAGAQPAANQAFAGIHFRNGDPVEQARFTAWLELLGIRQHAAEPARAGSGLAFFLDPGFAQRFVPDSDTLGLCQALGLDTQESPDHLAREIVLAMLAAPQPLQFPDFGEFVSAVRVRCNIVRAARRTQLAFHTSEAERPEQYWRYEPGRGFVVVPGQPLVAALEKATQPERSGKLFSFSCYRATEYVILLGLAQEMAHSNPALLRQLQAQWEARAIMSGEYHDVFLREYGSAEEPLPQGYYVPGDRVWFRNPDERSADASGYEGSWVIYLGSGLFANFWKRDQPYSFTEKCVEIYHWRHGLYFDAEGEARIDESIVEAKVRETMADPAQLARVLERMQRYRDPRGVYADGGCIDTSREFPRRVCVGTAEIALPGA